MKVAMNHIAPLERSPNAIFKRRHLSSHLFDERIETAGQEIAALALIYLPPAVRFSSGDSGLNQFPGDHAYHIPELQGRKMVHRASLFFFFLYSIHFTFSFPSDKLIYLTPVAKRILVSVHQRTPTGLGFFPLGILNSGYK